MVSTSLLSLCVIKGVWLENMGSGDGRVTDQNELEKLALPRFG